MAGRRELNKLDKVRRIKEAARELFISFGYDDTTTREIAIRAEVALGTIFTYAENKRDLLFLIANDDLEQAVVQAESAVRQEAPWIENAITIFRIHYELFQRQPALWKLVLRELLFYDSGEQAKRAYEIRMRLMRLLFGVLEAAKRTGEIKSAESITTIGWTIFGLYQAEIRRWLNKDRPSLGEGVRDVKRALLLLHAGLSHGSGDKVGRRRGT